MADTLTDTGLEPAPSPELDYHALMVEEGYYEGGVLERYSPEFVKAALLNQIGRASCRERV